MIDSKNLYEQLKQLQTEQRNPATADIDLSDSLEIVQRMNDEDQSVAHRVGEKLKEISTVVDWAHTSLSSGGRLIYAGAGTSGRLGVLDAAECPPTFGTLPDQVVGLIAGGREAMFVAQEGSEDVPDNGVKDISDLGAGPRDTVCGLAASGRTPYVSGVLAEARRRGARTVLVCCVQRNQAESAVHADMIIDIPVGPEVIMGSTRLKSATAQKMVCNMISTGALIRCGKVYENVMVDLMQTNQKLVERSRRIICMFTGSDYQESSRLLRASGGSVKVALVMGLTGTGREEAERLLRDHNGFIRRAITGRSIESGNISRSPENHRTHEA